MATRALLLAVALVLAAAPAAQVRLVGCRMYGWRATPACLLTPLSPPLPAACRQASSPSWGRHRPAFSQVNPRTGRYMPVRGARRSALRGMPRPRQCSPCIASTACPAAL